MGVNIWGESPLCVNSIQRRETRIRYYGFMSPASSVPLKKIAWLIGLTLGFEIKTPKDYPEPVQMPKCSHCGGILRHVAATFPFGPVMARTG